VITDVWKVSDNVLRMKCWENTFGSERGSPIKQRQKLHIEEPYYLFLISCGTEGTDCGLVDYC
jgi:hypothetical protein